MSENGTVVLIMGVTGSGKSTVARALAERSGLSLYDADDFHPPANIEKMARGSALTDEDRAPWLALLRARIEELLATRQRAVLACSALKQRYRDHLRPSAEQVPLVYLRGSRDQIAARLRARVGHFAGEALLDNQFAVLEEPTDALVFDIDAPPDRIAAEIAVRLGL